MFEQIKFLINKMQLKKMGGLRKLFAGDSHAVVQLETGYRNSDGQRTQTGIHQFLNFLEEHDALGEAFKVWLKSKRDEAKAKAAARKKAEKNGEDVEDEDDE